MKRSSNSYIYIQEIMSLIMNNCSCIEESEKLKIIQDFSKNCNADGIIYYSNIIK